MLGYCRPSFPSIDECGIELKDAKSIMLYHGCKKEIGSLVWDNAYKVNAQYLLVPGFCNGLKPSICPSILPIPLLYFIHTLRQTCFINELTVSAKHSSITFFDDYLFHSSQCLTYHASTTSEILSLEFSDQPPQISI